MSKESPISQIRSCLNCGSEISLANKNCAQCGQKTKSPKLTVWVILKDFFNRVFDLDSKFFRTFQHVWVPGKLTKAYIAGKREKYYNPIRILFIAMLVHFALLGAMVTSDVSSSISTEETKRRTHEMDLVNKIDSLAPTYLNREGKEDLDTLLANLAKERFKDVDTFFLRNANFFGLNFDSLKITKSDVFDMSESDVADKYGVTDKKERFCLMQIIKVYKNPKGLPAFLIGNSIWSIFIVLLFTALIMKLLYIRNIYYYAEHLVLLIHIHSTCFMIATFIYGLSYLMNDKVAVIDHGLTMDSPYSFAAIVLSSIFMFASLIAYYKQGFIKTAIKFFAISSAYVIILTFAVFLVSLLSLAFF